MNDAAMFDFLEALGRRFPELRGYYARATGGVDWAPLWLALERALGGGR